MKQVTRQNTAIADFLQKKKKTYAKSANANNFIHKGGLVVKFASNAIKNLAVYRKGPFLSSGARLDSSLDFTVCADSIAP